ncbi:PREDICTED: uncharacterized protein LOC108557892 [Nicrophorus vespilloides]|uniref:Uncharacterized protein LOC108557892 n=1 Tax=Nicrophorus vespilloides TaxID=110193 RepID=A0ABM1M693_NICVS|nr:PREDICTED: uncharacterized protein LOC108557892 [Nicrophorus vespilloides]
MEGVEKIDAGCVYPKEYMKKVETEINLFREFNNQLRTLKKQLKQQTLKVDEREADMELLSSEQREFLQQRPDRDVFINVTKKFIRTCECLAKLMEISDKKFKVIEKQMQDY